MTWGRRATTALPSPPDSTRDTTNIGFHLLLSRAGLACCRNFLALVCLRQGVKISWCWQASLPNYPDFKYPTIQKDDALNARSKSHELPLYPVARRRPFPINKICFISSPLAEHVAIAIYGQ